MRRLRDSVAMALLWRYGCHAVMILLSLLTEGRPAPSLPDLVLDRIPRVAWIDHYNYWLWLICYIPPALILWKRTGRLSSTSSISAGSSVSPAGFAWD